MIKGIRGLHHVAITVPDLKRAMQFYCGALGFEPIVQVDYSPKDANAAEGLKQVRRFYGFKESEDLDAAAAMLKTGHGLLELWQFRKPEPLGNASGAPNECGLMHIALQVENLEEVYPQLVAAGVQFTTPPQYSPEGTAALGRDPFGNMIEFFDLPSTSFIPGVDAS
jgi:glyoxylase I family protein